MEMKINALAQNETTPNINVEKPNRVKPREPTDPNYRYTQLESSRNRLVETCAPTVWAIELLLRIKLNIAQRVNTPFENLWLLKGQESYHYSLHINYVS